MLYYGGMTLGYLTPPAAAVDKKKAERFDMFSIFARKEVPAKEGEDLEREQELARAFMTPWHLFY